MGDFSGTGKIRLRLDLERKVSSNDAEKKGNLDGRNCSIRKCSGKMLSIFDYEFFFRVSFQVGRQND